MELDEAIAILIELLRTQRAGNYGYDLYARRVCSQRSQSASVPTNVRCASNSNQSRR
jgi:hypothetical protein